MIVLFTQSYCEPEEARRAELEECLTHNLANAHISLVVLFAEEHREAPKLRTILHSGRLSWDRVRSVANKKFPGNTCIVANSDIYFDETLGLLTSLDLTNKFLALAKWNGDKLFLPSTSQDAWIFHAPVRLKLDEYIGTRGIDHRLACIAKQNGYQLLNPSRSIICHHLHKSKVRHYPSKIIRRPYAFPPAVTLSQLNDDGKS